MKSRPKPIPEMRAHTPIPYDRVDKYSAASYAAQYGIALNDAIDMVERCNNHKEVERMIHAHYINDPEYRSAALASREIELLKERGVYKSKPGVGP